MTCLLEGAPSTRTHQATAGYADYSGSTSDDRPSQINQTVRNDEDDFPRITQLEKTYYHRINPAQGFGVQRVYTDDERLDETRAESDGDVVLVPRGHHPCGAPYGFEVYDLNVMAGPLRKWRFVPDPAVEWIMQRDA